MIYLHSNFVVIKKYFFVKKGECKLLRILYYNTVSKLNLVKLPINYLYHEPIFIVHTILSP